MLEGAVRDVATVATNGELLIDDREGSPTRGKVNALTIDPMRPRAVVIPPKLWHGVQNPSGEVSSFVNATDVTFEHADPDDWRVPPDHPRFPIASPGSIWIAGRSADGRTAAAFGRANRSRNEWLPGRSLDAADPNRLSSGPG